MKAVALVLAGLGALALAADPPQPVFPEPQHYVTDWILYNFTLNPKNPDIYEGDGRLQRDMDSQQFSDRMHVYYGHRHHPWTHHTVGHWLNEKMIWRVDYLPANKSTCSTSKTGGVRMPDPWIWVPSSKYLGRQQVHGQTVDVWGYAEPTDVNRHDVAVFPDTPNVPLFHNWEIYDTKGVLQIRFEERITNFTQIINPVHFQIPPECM